MEKIQKSFWPDQSWYFVTTATFLHYPYFRFDEQKSLVLNRLRQVETEFQIKIDNFSIAMNHFHYFFYLEDGRIYPKITQLLNGGVSFDYKKKFEKKYQNFWADTKTKIIATEQGIWRVRGYIAGNLLKHREVNNFYALADSPFCSYKKFAENYGGEFARNLVYETINFDEKTDGEVAIEDGFGGKKNSSVRKVEREEWKLG